MTISMYAASVPVLTRALGNLLAILDKAQAHATERRIDPAELLDARLSPDMLPLRRQVQIAGDFAKGSAARLAGVAVPEYDDAERDFDALKARIDRTLAFIDGLDPLQIAGSEWRHVSTRAGDELLHFKGLVYLTQYALPNFFFHMTTAYAILRHAGVELGKADFDGLHRYAR
ncbi:DUF1993 domain-containing protein [Piscinibacter sp.]|uniref:DUF1993 domain-containing protein n=1 Tax=Piscinibacter sp. TaxID=1903157 RepID=UPI002BBB9271|nr:DUF1993 domain-containing protein [Albitalea sp.]HUG23681.1 DUF1993 domain-containing protein [Albitalea sp.]